MPINPMYYFGQEAMRQITQAYDRGYNAGKQAKWHPYPIEKPTENKEYLTWVKFSPLQKKKCYDICEWECDGVFINGWNYTNDVEVYAWAELPEPYKEVEE